MISTPDSNQDAHDVRTRLLKILSICLLGWPLVLYSAESYIVPRTDWGQPDLQGVWNFSSAVPMQRPLEFGRRQFLTDAEASNGIRHFELGAGADVVPPNRFGIESYYNDIRVDNSGHGGRFRTSHIIYPLNGQIPPRIPGVRRIPGGVTPTDGERPVRFVVGGIGRDGPEDRGLSERCIVGFNQGPPFTPSLYNNHIQIIQNKDHVVIMTEMIHDARIVKLGSPEPLNDSIGLWSGDSIGSWEGETLVVETRNFNGKTQSFDGFGSSENKLLIERFSRIAPDAVNYEFTLEDPTTFVDKLTAIIPMSKVSAQLYEYACHEGNYGMANMLRAARRSDSRTYSDTVADLFNR